MDFLERLDLVVVLVDVEDQTRFCVLANASVLDHLALLDFPQEDRCREDAAEDVDVVVADLVGTCCLLPIDPAGLLVYMVGVQPRLCSNNASRLVLSFEPSVRANLVQDEVVADIVLRFGAAVEALQVLANQKSELVLRNIIF